jgi:oligopeptide/dipeptide ABC transporter ATP-binding protein
MNAAAAHETPAPLLDMAGLRVVYQLGRGRPPVRAVDGVNLSIGERETLGLVGESGSGKSTIGRAILGLTPVADGTIRFAGRDITRATGGQRRELSSALQVVFQDPYSSLNPARTVGQTLAETLRAHGPSARAAAGERMAAMLARVGLPADATSRYPAQFSGGQRQRIAIARALMASPQLVICDEAVSALDLSVQAQVLNLLRELQHDLGLSYLFISHDLAVVRHLAHRVLVLYQGRAMEYGPAATIYRSPAHPYTRALLEAVPVPDPEQQRRRREAAAPGGTGQVAGRAPADSCPFAPRCPHAVELCWQRRPEPEITPDNTMVACHHWPEILKGDPHAHANLDAQRAESGRRSPTPGNPESRAAPARP